MNRLNQMSSPLDALFSGADLAGQVSHYRDKQNIYQQGEPADSLFYIEEGGVRLSTQTKHKKSAGITILGVDDLFGEACLAGYPVRTSTAVALGDSSIRAIEKSKMLQRLREENNKASNCLVSYLLSSIQNYKAHVADLLTSYAERRLALVLLRLARLDKDGPAVVTVPLVDHRVLAEMIGTTRGRVNLFMNRFRKRGFVNYSKKLEIHKSLRKVL